MSKAKKLLNSIEEVLGRRCKEELKSQATQVLNHLRTKFKQGTFSINPVKSAGNGLPSFVRISIKSNKFFEDPLAGLRRKFGNLNFTIETRKKEGSQTSSILVSMVSDNRPMRATVKKT